MQMHRLKHRIRVQKEQGETLDFKILLSIY